MELSQVTLGAVLPEEEARFRALMGTHHYLGAAPKVGETLWYGAAWRGEWVALASFSAAALKCQARDAWIGWDAAPQVRPAASGGQQHPVPVLRPVPNLGSRVLGLCARHLVRDWPARFHHPLVLLETFVGPVAVRGHGLPGRGLDRGRHDARLSPCPGRVPRRLHAEEGLCPSPDPPRPSRALHSHPGAPLPPWEDRGTMLSAEQMRSLPDVLRTITDPRSRYGRRYRLETLLALAAAATLCGARGYKAIHEWVATSRRRCCATSAAAVSTAPTSDRASTVYATPS